LFREGTPNRNGRMGLVKHSMDFHCVVGGCFSTCKVACQNCNALCMSGRAHLMGVANFHCSFELLNRLALDWTMHSTNRKHGFYNSINNYIWVCHL
jgi:hypothetical protein